MDRLSDEATAYLRKGWGETDPLNLNLMQLMEIKELANAGHDLDNEIMDYVGRRFAQVGIKI